MEEFEEYLIKPGYGENEEEVPGICFGLSVLENN